LAFQHDGGSPALLHYANGTLANVSRFGNVPVYQVAHIPGTTQQLVTDFTGIANGTKVRAEVLQGN
jgi:hypothetical protein